MTMEYKLLAADMDGTALSDSKELGPRTVEAMKRAIANGKTVVFSTGRSISLIRPYIDMVSGMRYAVTSSGASVMDLKTGEKLLYKTIEPETVKYIIAQSSGRYVMPVMFMDDKSYGTRWCVDNCADFGLKAYEPIYRTCMNIVDDAFIKLNFPLRIDGGDEAWALFPNGAEAKALMQRTVFSAMQRAKQ